MGFKSNRVFHNIRGTVSTRFEQAYAVEGIVTGILGHKKTDHDLGWRGSNLN
jgi:hypothetical protein